MGLGSGGMTTPVLVFAFCVHSTCIHRWNLYLYVVFVFVFVFENISWSLDGVGKQRYDQYATAVSPAMQLLILSRFLLFHIITTYTVLYYAASDTEQILYFFISSLLILDCTQCTSGSLWNKWNKFGCEDWISCVVPLQHWLFSPGIRCQLLYMWKPVFV